MITPGEWKYGIRDDGSMWLSLGDPAKGPHYQGDLCASVDDARLIVAARELREALEDVLVNGLPDAAKSCGHDFFCVCPGIKARATLAKVRGEA